MIKAVFFDFDGTIMDSESQTPASIRQAMAGFGFPEAYLPPAQTQGRPFHEIAEDLDRLYGPFPPERLTALPQALADAWYGMVKDAVPLPGALDAVHRAAASFEVALVSSSMTRYLDEHVGRLGLGERFPPGRRIGRDKVTRSKPHPEGYLKAAALCGVHPEECLVFEDSSAGIRSAKAAGMHCVAITCLSAEKEAAKMADLAVGDFTELPDGFWASLPGAKSICLPTP